MMDLKSSFTGRECSERPGTTERSEDLDANGERSEP
jgi:hypothetical protein